MERRRHVRHRLPDVPRAGREVRRRSETSSPTTPRATTRCTAASTASTASRPARREDHRGTRDRRRRSAGRRDARAHRRVPHTSSGAPKRRPRPQPTAPPTSTSALIRLKSFEAVPIRGRRSATCSRSRCCSGEARSATRDLESSTPAMSSASSTCASDAVETEHGNRNSLGGVRLPLPFDSGRRGGTEPVPAPAEVPPRRTPPANSRADGRRPGRRLS